METLTPPTSGPYRAESSAQAAMRRAVKVVVAGLFGLLAVVAIAMLFIDAPYFGISPGSTRSTEDRLTVHPSSDVEQFPSEGEVYFTTVTLERLSLWGWLLSDFRSDTEVVEEEIILGSRSQEENREVNRRLMSTSQDDAVIVAMSRLGRLGTLEVEVSSIRPDSAAAELIVPGSRIVAVNGSETGRVTDVVEALDGVVSGDVVSMELEGPDGARSSIEVPVAAFDDDPRTESRDSIPAGLGLSLSDREVFESVGAQVVGLYEGMPAETVLDLGDVIRSVNGTPISTPGSLVEVIRDLSPGDSVEMVIGRLDDETETVEVQLGTRPDDPGTPEDESLDGFLGADVQQDVEAPVDIDFDADNVGGPSAGMAFTLAIIDLLSPGDLFNGQPVAVTGTIALDGSVGPIGGIDQKAIAVRDGDFDIFFVPNDNNIEMALETAAGEYEVFPVDTVDRVLSELLERGGAAEGVRVLEHDLPI